MTFNPNQYGPVFAPLLDVAELNPLGPGAWGCRPMGEMFAPAKRWPLPVRIARPAHDDHGVTHDLDVVTVIMGRWNGPSANIVTDRQWRIHRSLRETLHPARAQAWRATHS